MECAVPPCNPPQEWESAVLSRNPHQELECAGPPRNPPQESKALFLLSTISQVGICSSSSQGIKSEVPTSSKQSRVVRLSSPSKLSIQWFVASSAVFIVAAKTYFCFCFSCTSSHNFDSSPFRHLLPSTHSFVSTRSLFRRLHVAGSGGRTAERSGVGRVTGYPSSRGAPGDTTTTTTAPPFDGTVGSVTRRLLLHDR